jgi:hypothetical protein
MVAAALTPTSVTKTALFGTDSYETPVRMIRYIAKITKVTLADWVVAGTYFPGTIIYVDGNTFDSGGDGVQEAPTYTASGDKIILGTATVGTTYLEVVCKVS